MYTDAQLQELQSKSLDEKIQLSTARIIEWYEHFEGKVYVSFSGGKDSTVLLHLVRSIYPEVPAVFSDTGLEYPEIREFVKTVDNVEWIYPEKFDRKLGKYKRYSFKQVITDCGYPIISKEQASKIYEYRNTNSRKLKDTLINGNRWGMGKIHKKWLPCVNADFRISGKCCNYMKKYPFERFETRTGLKPYLGTMAVESRLRASKWKEQGCNSFTAKRQKSAPLSFWTEEDVLEYLLRYKIPYCPIYGDIIKTRDGVVATGVSRTGCIFCGFGCQLEKEPNRFQQLKQTHPQLYDYCMRGGKYDEDGMWIPDNGLGMAKVLDYIGVKTGYSPEEGK